MSDETKQAIETAAENRVRSYQVDGERVDSHSIKDLIEADKYLTTREKKESCGTFGAVANMLGKIRPVNQ